MTKLTREGTKFNWTEDCQTGFDYLKACLTESPILRYPDPHKDIPHSLILVIKLQQQISLRNTLMMMTRLKKCQLLTFLHSSLIHSSSGALLSKKVMQSTMLLKSGDTASKIQETLLKSDAQSPQKFLNGKTNNVKLDIWS